MAGKRVFTAKETFHTEVDGVPVTVKKGARYREGHPMLKDGRDVNFETEDETAEIEEATAEPGKKRGA